MPNIIDKLFSKLTKHKAPDELKRRILLMSELKDAAKQKPKQIESEENTRSLFGINLLMMLKPVVALVLVLALVGGVYYQFFRIPKLASAFTLQAETSDDSGVPGNGAFILKSSKSITSFQLKRVVKFEPNVEFTVDSLGDNNFRIKPKAELPGDSVYKIKIEEGVADRDYSWAYQIKSNFAVLSTTPGDKGTNVPSNTGIEMVFNRENIEGIEKYFEITPKAEGKFETHGDTVVFIPKSLEDNKVYTVTVKKGLGAKGATDTLPKDYSFSFETTNANGTQDYSYFSLQRDFEVVLPGKKQSFGLFYYGVDPVKDVTSADVYKFNNSKDFIESYSNSRNWDYSWTTYYRANGIEGKAEKARKILSFKPTIQTVQSQSFFDLPESLNEGFYLVDVTTAKGTHAYAWTQVTPISQYFSVTHDRGLMWVKDFNTKSSVSNAKVSTVFKGETKELGKTDSNGLMQFDTPEFLKAENENFNPVFLQVESSGKSPLVAIAQDRWGGSGAYKGDVYWKYLVSDRSVYQMTDDINFWGIAKGRSEDLRQKKINVGLYTGYYYAGDKLPVDARPLVSMDVTISNFDTYEGKLAIKGLQPSTYSLIATNGREIITSTSVEVLTYDKPAYQISVKPSKDNVFAGEPVDFEVSAALFDGTPITNTEIAYTGYFNGQMDGTIKLDSKGLGRVTITPQYVSSDFYPRTLNMSFRAANTEIAEITTDSSVNVFGPHMYLQGYQTKQNGDEYTFKAKLNDIVIDTNKTNVTSGYYYQPEFVGGPVINYSLNAKITKIYYVKVETGEAYDPISKLVYKTYRYDRKEEVVENITGNTDNSGEWNFSKNLPAVKDGYYSIEVTGKDRQNRDLKTNFGAYKEGYYTAYDNYNPTNPFSVELRIPNTTDYERYSKQYSVGDEINLNIAAIEGRLENNSQILYYRWQNSIGKAVVTDSQSFSEKFAKEFAPNVQYRAVVLGPYGFVETNTVYANFKSEDNKLSIDIKSNKEQYRPGEKVTLDISTRNKDKNGVSAEVNLAVVDEAIFYVKSIGYQPEVLSTLYQTIYTQPIVNYTNYLVLGNPGGGAEKGGCFLAGTQILMANGRTKSIEDLVIGDEILTRLSDINGKKVKATIQGTSSHKVGGYLVVNGKLRVTPEHVVFSNGEWKEMARVRVGDTMIDTTGNSVRVDSMEVVNAPGTEVYNIVVNKYHTYFADGLYVHNAEKGGGVRSNFKDTAAFKTVRTSGSGNATMDFDLPDNVTSWRVTARGYSQEDLLAGENKKQVIATLPFFVDSVANNFYLTGDKPVLKVRTFGTGLVGNQPVKYSVKIDALKYSSEKEVSGSLFETELPVLSAGQYEILVSAKQGKNEDAILKRITVLDSYFRKSESETKNLSEGKNQVKGNEQGITELVFAETGVGKYYGLLNGSRYGGTRADQQVASFESSKLLHTFFGEEEGQSLDILPYQRNGGVSLLSYSDPDLLLSAKIADLSPENVDKQRLVKYFKDEMKNDKADTHRIAVALYGLASLNEPVLSKLQSVKDNSDFSREDRVYLALGLARFGDTESARKIYYDSIKSKLDFNGVEASIDFEKDKSKKVKITGSVAQLAAMLEIKDDAEKLAEYIKNHNPERDLDVIEEVLVARELLSRSDKSTASFEFTLDGKTEKVELKNGNSKTLRVTTEQLKSITYSSVSGKISVTGVRQVASDPNSLKKEGRIGVERTYTVNGKEVSEFKDGDIVKVTVKTKLEPGSLDGEYQIVDYLPSGLKPITDPYSVNKSFNYSCDNYIWYPNRIENNSVYFTTYNYPVYGNSCSQPTINYFARVVSKGQFKANPALIQSVRDLDYLNTGSTQNIVIR